MILQFNHTHDDDEDQLFSNVADEGQEASRPWHGKCKNWAPLADISVFCILLVFSRLLFFLRVWVFSIFKLV